MIYSIIVRNLFLLIFVLTFSGCSVGVSKPKEQEQPKNSPSATYLDTDGDPINDMAEWKKYSDASVEFDYPSLVSVKQEGESIILNHAIDYKHNDMCDFKGDAPALDKLSDFVVSLKISNQNLKDAIQSNEGSEYVIENFFENNTLTLSEGFIDNFNAGSLNGFQITNGVEGCGRYTYYFPISSNKILVVNRSFVPELTSINGNYQTYLNLPGIIPPDQEKENFVKILTSLKVKL